MSRGGGLILVVVTLLIGGCVIAPLPVEEYTIAHVAVTAARDAGADRLAPGLWYKAEENYRRGEKSLRDKDNNAARDSFLKAIEFAEKAENAARLKKFETGEAMQ